MVSLTIYHANACDRRKCTALKLWHFYQNQRFSDSKVQIRMVNRLQRIPRYSLVLNPLAPSYLSVQDLEIFHRSGLTILDCSWGDTETIFSYKFPNARKLPILLAANPVNYGKWQKLSSIEALAASLHLLGLHYLAKDLLSIFNWGTQFFNLNDPLLTDYARCQSGEEIFHVEQDFLDRNRQ